MSRYHNENAGGCRDKKRGWTRRMRRKKGEWKWDCLILVMSYRFFLSSVSFVVLYLRLGIDEGLIEEKKFVGSDI